MQRINMEEYSSSLTVDEWVALGVNPETGEIVDTRRNDPEGPANTGDDQQNFTESPVKNYRRGSRKSFNKFYDLGAHAMIEMPVCKLTKTMAVLMRDSTYKGISYVTPAIVGAEIGVDDEYARKLLKKTEQCGFAMKVRTPSGYYYLLNPNYCFSGDEREERIAKSIWSKERTRRLEATSKTKKAAPQRP